MAVGPDTYVSDLLNTTGFLNVCERALGRYPKTTVEAVLEEKPQLILLPDEPYEFSDMDRAYLKNRIKSRGAHIRVENVEGTLLTWFGSRTLLGLEYLWEIRRNIHGSG
jgi:hypothetical protein